MRNHLKQKFRSRKRELAAAGARKLAVLKGKAKIIRTQKPVNTPEVPPTYETVRAAATAVTHILSEMGITCAIFGSLAYKIYGSIDRDPESLSVVVWPPTAEKYDLQLLRSQIADADFTVFSLGSKSQRSKESGLWYRGRPNDKASHCQIIIIVPGMQDLPGISVDRISLVDGLPLIPIPIVLFQLLVQWERKTQNGTKEYQYTSDIRAILASSHMENINIQRPWREPGLFGAETQQILGDSIQRYCGIFPKATGAFGRLGLPVNLSCESAARAVIQVLKEMGMVAAIYGSLACRLYSDSARNPKNINVLVWSLNSRHVDLEGVKEQMAARDSTHLTVVPPIAPSQAKPALWYRGSEEDKYTHFRIEIRVPAMNSLPKLMPNHINELNDISLVPFAVALIDTLGIWDFECLRARDKPDHHRRANDVQRMLKSRHAQYSSRNKLSWKGNIIFSDTYRETVRLKIRRFCDMYPDATHDWRLLELGLFPTAP
ncbi:hypothetical protein FIBSPDRAFT_1037998 [Athelia psychrophila]|uniref:Uncharacterized protein n=1 Tax=Athelia psychrophila TaxID=1759441 RepID=A0A166TLA5_9AGAM|nr:hypothetical protein FIBSPDRAFT_1037998 [Fibularhizoctonia sp. CBS 109695]